MPRTRNSNKKSLVEPEQEIDRLERTLRRQRQLRMAEQANERVMTEEEQTLALAAAAALAGGNQPVEPQAGVHNNQAVLDDAIHNPVENIVRIPDGGNNQHLIPPGNVRIQHQAQHLPPQGDQHFQQPLRQRPVQHQTIGDVDSSAAFFFDRNPIRPPTPVRNDFEIKPQIIALVKQNQFHGLSTEHPLDHLDTFEEICSTTRANGVPADYFKCKLFSFSLNDKALRWMKSLPPRSITTWDEYKEAFLNQFYTKQRSNSIRNKISSFRQGPTESFFEALERFKEYTRDCPNHGFSEGNLWNIFYNGIDYKHQTSLNAASNGNFMTKLVPEAKLLIENLAASDANCSQDYNRTINTTKSSTESSQIAELKNMVSQLLRSQRGVHAIEEVNDVSYDPNMERIGDGMEENQEEVNYIGGNFGNRNFNNNNNFRSHPNLSYRSTNVENPQDQFYPRQNSNQGGQFQPKQPFYSKGMYQVKPPFNPTQPSGPVSFDAKLEDMKNQMLEAFGQHKKEVNQMVESKYSELNTRIESVCTHLVKMDTQLAQTSEAVRRQEEEKAKKFCNVASTIEEEAVAVPSLPKEEVISVQNPKEERLPGESKRAYKRRLKRIPLEKINDPGKFVFPCSINGKVIHDCLCDTGANVNVMSLAMARELGLADFKPSKVYIEYADLSSSTPYGMLENVMIKVGEGVVPTDFQVLEMKTGKLNPLILGLQFLATAGAIVDFPNRRISFANINKNFFYEELDARRIPSSIGMKNLKPSIDPGDAKKEAKKGDLKAKEKMVAKLSKERLKEVYKDVKPISTPMDDSKSSNKAKEKPTFEKMAIKILVPRGEEIDKDLIKRKLENTLKLFPDALVVKYDDLDSLGVILEDGGMKLNEAKGTKIPLVDLPEV